MLKGPDVSLYQGSVINWGLVAKAGASFAAAKCTEGSGWADPTFPRNWQGMADAGMARIAYHFARPDLATTAQAEAQWFLDHLPALIVGDIICLDIEVPTSGAGAQDVWALAWLQTVDAQTGVRPLLYTGPWYAQGLARLSDARLAAYPLWNAAYQAPPAPSAYSPWQRVHLWQWTSAAAYPSIGQCDESYFLAGSIDALRALGKAAPPAPAANHPSAPASYREAGKRWRLGTAMHFRPLPNLAAVPLGPLLPAGTYVVELAAPPGLPIETTSWAWCRTGGDVQGYLLKANMQQTAP